MSRCGQWADLLKQFIDLLDRGDLVSADLVDHDALPEAALRGRAAGVDVGDKDAGGAGLSEAGAEFVCEILELEAEVFAGEACCGGFGERFGGGNLAEVGEFFADDSRDG